MLAEETASFTVYQTALASVMLTANGANAKLVPNCLIKGNKVCFQPVDCQVCQVVTWSLVRSEQKVEVHQPGRAGGPECIAHPQHPIRPHVTGRPLLHDVGGGDGGGPEGAHVPAHHPAAEEMQCEGHGALPRRRHRVPVQRHPEAGRPLPHLHSAEQPAVRRHLQPAGRHLPGDVPAEDPHHGSVQRAHAAQVSVQSPVGFSAAAVRRSRHRTGAAGGEEGGVRVGRLRPELHGWFGCRGDQLPVVGLRRRLLREDPEGELRLGVGEERAAGDLRHGARHAGTVVERRRGRGRARLPVRLHGHGVVRHLQPGVRRAAGGRGGEVRRQHPEGLRHLLLHHRLHGDVRLPVRLPRGPALHGGGGARHRRRLHVQPPESGRRLFVLELLLVFLGVFSVAEDGGRRRDGGVPAKMRCQGKRVVKDGLPDKLLPASWRSEQELIYSTPTGQIVLLQYYFMLIVVLYLVQGI